MILLPNLLVFLFLAQNTGMVRCPLNDVPASEKAELRRQWRLEEDAHQVKLIQWRREQQEHEDEQNLWERERVAHRIEREDWDRQRTKDEKAWRKHQEAARAAHREERERWKRERVEEEEAWRKHQEAARAAHREERERWNRQRVEEEEAWRNKQEAARAAHREERESWKRQRVEEEEAWRNKQEDARREEEHRRQAARDAFRHETEGWELQRREEESHRLEVVRRSQGVYWTEPHGDWRCHSYGTRTYTAYLRDIPGDLNWLEVCYNMPPVVINGREVSKPFKCERNNNEVVGVWYIDFNEPSCVPYWDHIYNKGCAAGQTGVQRLEARLDGLISNHDWYMICSTTPATIHGVHFDHPTSCESRGRDGMVGMWDFPNARCL